MVKPTSPIFIGQSELVSTGSPVRGKYVQIAGETCYRISNVDQMPPFLISLISAADHWCFITSNGGVTAGRVQPDNALFPYETEDKLVANHELSGSKSVLRVQRDGRSYLWEPFSDRYDGLYERRRNLYKNVPGSRLIFEEINSDLGLTMQSIWQTSDRFGFVRSVILRNDGQTAVQLKLVDGWQNLLPAGATVAAQNRLSSLLNAYKRNELDPATGLGLFALSATITDLAAPSESLRATVAWQAGLPDPCYLLTTRQLDAFRHGRELEPELDVRGMPGAYLVASAFALEPGEERAWHMVADVQQDSTAVVDLQQLLRRPAAARAALLEDVAAGARRLTAIVAAADGLQRTAVPTTDAHHFANVLFNVMRGGLFADNYRLSRVDLVQFLQQRNQAVAAAYSHWLASLPEVMTIDQLYALAEDTGAPDLVRLCYEYLPLMFSRRHGDPSRPWNHFAIYLKDKDGRPRFDYQGNWRDIFQNWEPLALSYPHFLRGMIAKFLNATTADGYNPYRVTREGIEWEVPEPDDPWANIGYWNDHQIIYLQKLLEINEQIAPGDLAKLWHQPIFSYANVPYRQREYEQVLDNWYETIDFDSELDAEIMARVAQLGSDGRLLRDEDGRIIHVTMGEKLLLLLLVKLSNFVPGGGIWMNTQRPEWNDANNALVGKGLSVVTTAYLRRFVCFWRMLLAGRPDDTFLINSAAAELFAAVRESFATFAPQLETGIDSRGRRVFMDRLGTAVAAYRRHIYNAGIPSEQHALSARDLQQLLELAQQFLDDTLRRNKRADDLFHAYNVLALSDDSAHVEHLYLMLEGQVAALSSGLLTAEESAALLRSLHQSDLYRPDQHSFMLYPNRDLPGFLQKNNVHPHQVAQSPLVQALTAAGDRRLLRADAAGIYHFNADFHNADDVRRVLVELQADPALAPLVAAEEAFILRLFEETFDHQRFTGRSGTFFAYEGLGSIYWHMVSKLLLAVQESYFDALHSGAEAKLVAELADHYHKVRQGLGFNKPAHVYGAFPTDPYSHTPLGGGARQPGMTGQVKEEILTRWGELGVGLRDGRLRFDPTLLCVEEFFEHGTEFSYFSLTGEVQTIAVPAGALAFTLNQVPVLYSRAAEPDIEIVFRDGRVEKLPGSELDEILTRQLLSRDGTIDRLHAAVVL